MISCNQLSLSADIEASVDLLSSGTSQFHYLRFSFLMELFQVIDSNAIVHRYLLVIEPAIAKANPMIPMIPIVTAMPLRPPIVVAKSVKNGRMQ